MRRRENIGLLGIVLIFLVLIFSDRIQGQLMSSVKPDALARYKNCTFHDGLRIIEVDSLAPGITERSVETAQGSKPIQMLAGNRIGFAYPNTDIFANVKAEQLPPDSWESEKKTLQQNFEYLLHSSPDFKADPISDRNLLSLDSQGMTKTFISGGVLAFYLFFDKSRNVVITVYLVNQKPSTREFQTLDEFHVLESRFLRTYSACIAGANH